MKIFKRKGSEEEDLSTAENLSGEATESELTEAVEELEEIESSNSSESPEPVESEPVTAEATSASEEVFQEEIAVDQVEPEVEIDDVQPIEQVETKPQITEVEELEELPESLKLLKDGTSSSGTSDIDEQAKTIESVFKNFGVRSNVTGFKQGPRVTRFEVTPGRGVKIEKITKLRDELRLALAVDRINILSPVPGQNHVGVEVPRRHPDLISLGDVLKVKSTREDTTQLLIAVGQSVEGKPVVADIEAMPHLLVAGQTGSGKSSFINSLICSLIIRNDPMHLRLALIDPKRVELANFEGIPHLVTPVATENESAVQILKWAIAEMEARYQEFQTHRVNRIQKYNKGVTQGKIAGDVLPRLVVVIDELADLMKTSATPVEPLIIRITQLGRAAGIHLVAATQRPSADVITGLIKANIPTRIAFATASMIDSRVILDTPGAETLTGEGDGLLSMSGSNSLVRFQGAYTDEETVEEIVDFVSSNPVSKEILESIWKVTPPDIDVSEIDLVDVSNFEDLPLDEDSKLTGGYAEVKEEVTEEEDPFSHLMEIPEWQDPDWREELALVKRRIEPCDLTEHFAGVTQKRLLARTIDAALLKVRLRISERFSDRAIYRFKDQIDEHDAIQDALDDLSRWKVGQSNSVAWQLIERVNQESERAKTEQLDAISSLKAEEIFENPKAIEHYRRFASTMTLAPLFMLYVDSVLALTYNRFEWLLQHFPIFNLGLGTVFLVTAGATSWVIVRAAWKYSSQVALVQKKVVKFQASHARQFNVVKWATKEQARLSLQQPLLEPMLKVLAVGYRAPWNDSIGSNPKVTTAMNTSKLPGCITFARAVEGDGMAMTQLQHRALETLVAPGWRTQILEELGKLHAESQIADASSMRLSALDVDLGQSTSSTRAKLLEAFTNEKFLQKVGRDRLRQTINVIHMEVLRNSQHDLRPPVKDERINGYESLSLNTSWLDYEDGTQNWVDFLTEVTGETSPFNPLNIQDKRSGLSNTPKSLAVVPAYLAESVRSEKIQVETQSAQLSPIDVVVRIDVSEWVHPSAFKVFAREATTSLEDLEPSTDSNLNVGPTSV
jgi:GTPase SAR1 family protein